MFDRFTKHAKKTMNLAERAAKDLNHEYIGTEHILLGLIREDNGVGAGVLRSMGIDLKRVVKAVERAVKPGRRVVKEEQLPFTPRCKRVLELSMEEASALSHNYIGTEHLLLGLIGEGEGIAAQVLINLGVVLEHARQRVVESLGESDGPNQAGQYRVTAKMIWTHWYTNGQRQSEGSYENRERQGHWTFWNEDGSVDEKRTGLYEDGELTKG